MITKDLILQKISEVEIITNFVPDFNPSTPSKNYKSVFSDTDNTPSLNFYKHGVGWKFKSHNTGHQGDVWQFAADIYKLDSKKDFHKVLSNLNEDLNLNITVSNVITKPHVIEFQEFNELFLNYWKEYKVFPETLIKYNVQQLAYHEFHNKDGIKRKFFYKNTNTIVVCYTVNNRIKLYIPAIPELITPLYKFAGQTKKFGYKNQTSSDIFGFAQLPEKCDYIIFCAGEKDCLVANAHGFNSLSCQSEHQLPSISLIESLKKKTSHLLCCYDNDQAGKQAAEKLNKTFGIQPIFLPAEFKDLALFFKSKNKEDFEILLQNALFNSNLKQEQEKIKRESGKTVFGKTREYLNRFYHIRVNTIKHVYEFAPIGGLEFKELNENALFIELQEAGISISLNNLKAFLKSGYCTDYNPLAYYFENLKPWKEGDTDYISKFANYVKAENQQQFNHHLKKWLVRSVKCALVDGYYNKQAFILVHSDQNAGKTSWCRYLCPPSLRDYIIENINPDNKDSIIALATNFLVNLDELKSLSRSDINTLKSFFSIDKVNVRLPYESRNITAQRVCNFIGSTNEAQFLSDETGSVRWLCFNISAVNHNYNNYITGVSEMNIDDVWSQAYSLFKSGFKSELSPDEIRANEDRNSVYRQLPPEFEFLPRMFERTIEQGLEFFMTSSEIASHMANNTKLKISPVNVGKALKFHGFDRIKSSSLQVYGYFINKLPI